jgi:uracil-DNA glycosylase family 4
LQNVFKTHVAKWKDCQACDLCQNRRKVVLFRGDLPCEVLFVGEAPGESEDVMGEPFVGPAGDLFNHILLEVMENISKPFTYGITNIVGCWPVEATDTSYGHTREPSKQEAIKCRSRLLELIKLAKPRIILALGNTARQQLPRPLEGKIREASLLHPAAILRRDSTASANLDFKRMIRSIEVYTQFLRD